VFLTIENTIFNKDTIVMIENDDDLLVHFIDGNIVKFKESYFDEFRKYFINISDYVLINPDFISYCRANKNSLEIGFLTGEIYKFEIPVGKVYEIQSILENWDGMDKY